MSTNNKPKTCGDCGTIEGDVHEYGCDMERCPFCGEQLIACDCCYTALMLIDKSQHDESTCYLPPEIYRDGLTEDQRYAWFVLLETKGRIPWISYPNTCCRCGKLWPDMFKVSNPEWNRYIEPHMRREMLCQECYDWIKQRVDDAESKRKENEG